MKVQDAIHKLFKPSTYPCNLCAITFGYFTMKKEWKIFINELTIPTEFLHIDKFQEKFPDVKDLNFPSAFYQSNKSINLFISCDEMNRLRNLTQLIEIVKIRLNFFKKSAVIQPPID